MRIIIKLIATVSGIGYLQKGAGTLAALFYCGAWWWLRWSSWPAGAQIAAIILLFIAGVYVSDKVEGEWGHDSNRIVVDEVLGMAVALFMVPRQLTFLAAAFVLFRVFDIAKPLFIKRLEALPGGRGVMADDLLAGVYANLLVQLLMAAYFHHRV